MAGLKQLKRRLVSVRNTKKITGAMKLVSAAKLRKAQESVVNSRSYAQNLSRVLDKLVARSRAIPGVELTHPLAVAYEKVTRVRVIVVGGSRGLCGAYNTNLNKRVEAAFGELRASYPQAEVEFEVFGRKPAEYLRRMGRVVRRSHEELPEDPTKWPLEECARDVESDYQRGHVQEVRLVFTEFRSALSTKPVEERLLPFSVEASLMSSTDVAEGEDIVIPNDIVEPTLSVLFENVIPRLVRVRVLQIALEAKASEHGNRMTAMDAASKNAGELSTKLQLLYNRERQSSITSELLDIVGGAEALRG